jgi:hypothetical protein
MTTVWMPPALATALPEAVVALTELATALPAGRVTTAALPTAVVAAGAVVLTAALPAVVLAAADPVGRVATAALAAALVGAAAVVGATVAATGFGVSVALLPPQAARIALPAAAPASIRNPRRGSRRSGIVVIVMRTLLFL